MPLFVLRIAEGGAADVDRRLRVSMGDFVYVNITEILASLKLVNLESQSNAVLAEPLCSYNLQGALW